jgi:hypothetical protein
VIWIRRFLFLFWLSRCAVPMEERRWQRLDGAVRIAGCNGGWRTPGVCCRARI